jgi:multidrug transporter EmrE-like cation transporter
MAWLYLVAAGLAEIGWPVGLKWAQEPARPVVGVALAIGAMAGPADAAARTRSGSVGQPYADQLR